MRIFSCLIFLLIAVASLAQPVATDSVKFSKRSILKWSPFHLAGFYPSIQLAYEFQFHKNHSIQLDAGYVIDIEENSDLYKNKRGVKLKTEWRYYLETNSRRRILYLALEPYANIINFDRNEFNTECFDVECTVLFTREYNYKVRYRETGVSFKLGTQLQAKRFTFDFSHGLMLRDINYNKPVIPRGIDDVDQFGWVFTPNEKKRVVFGPVVGIRIGYILSK